MLPTSSQPAADHSIERLRKSVLELLETEYAYIRHLETICEHYMSPLEGLAYLNIPDLKHLRQVIAELISFQRDFFDKLIKSIAAANARSPIETGASGLAADVCGATATAAATKSTVGPTTMAPPVGCYSASGSKEQLTTATTAAETTAKLSQQDEFEELNKIVKQLELFNSIELFKPSLSALSKVFQSESERFKLYASYCSAYARFQKLLHPKRQHQSAGALGYGQAAGSAGGAGGSSGSASMAGQATPGSTVILSLPSALDTFTSAHNTVPISSLLAAGTKQTGGSGGVGGHLQTHREFLMRPLSSFMASHQAAASSAAEATQFSAQLRQLGEFLGSLDSSSSSASLSLAKSSSASELCQAGAAAAAAATDSKQSKQSAVATATAAAKAQAQQQQGPFQKSVHQQNFESYLIKPIQRIVKYPMLLNSITISAAQVFALAAANSSQQQPAMNEESNNIDDNGNRPTARLDDGGLLLELQAAVEQMESITSHVNDAQRIYDDYGLLFDQIERLYLERQAELACSTAKSAAAATATAAAIPLLGSAHQPPISLSIDQLLYFGSVDWLNVQEFTSTKQLKKGINNLSQLLFVFTSCVVFICKERIRTTTTSTPLSLLAASSQQQQQASSKRRGLSAAGSHIAGFVSANNSSHHHHHGPNNLLATNSSTTNSGPTPGGHNLLGQQTPQTSSNTKASSNLDNKKFLSSHQQEHCQEVIRYQTLIPVSEVQVRSVPAGAATRSSAEVAAAATANSNDCFQWELFRCSSVNSNSNLLAKSSVAGAPSSKAGGGGGGSGSNSSKGGVGKVYLLSCSTNEARSTFLRKTRFTIRESVRNMSLPLARSPSSKSLTPKKFSSPSSGTNTNSSCSHSTSLSPVCCQKNHSNNKDNATIFVN